MSISAKRQKAESRKQKAESRKQKAENRKQKTESRKQKYLTQIAPALAGAFVRTGTMVDL
jgi:hypothetical protein